MSNGCAVDLRDLVKNELEQKEGVYYLKDHRSFNYSDGTETENYIRNVINDAKDISSNSRELEGRIKDWPSLYHLSRARSLAYESLELPSSASVLEVGCGCGAITRFLGERVAHVVALEGSARRAHIARARTRDLESVAVLCASFQEVVFDGSFDFVICNGVLEYAPLFVNHKYPARELIRLLTSLLAPSGNLIVAIENKLGLRYFASGREEHTNIMFDGLEGYARFPNGPATFGFLELHGMLREHCAFVETLLPLPDYKLPRALIRAELLDEVNCADLFASVSRYDFGTYEEPRMHERLVWHELQNNNLLKIFSNSYLMIAGHKAISLFRQGWMGDIYAIKRNTDLMVKTTVSKLEGGDIRTKKNYFQCRGMVTKQTFTHTLDESSWVNGVSIHTMIARAMLGSDGHLPLEDRLGGPLLAWWEEIKVFGLKGGTLQGNAYDCIWQNAILKNGKVYFIDKEWVSNCQIEPAWLIYRSVATFLVHESYYLHRWNRSCRNLSEIMLLRTVARVVGSQMTLHSVVKAIHFNLDLLESVDGKQSDRFERFAKVSVAFIKLFVPFSVLKYKRDTLFKVKSILTRAHKLSSRIFGRW